MQSKALCPPTYYPRIAYHMAACYYLDCSCGKRLTVEPRHAGSQLKCDCGATLEVPTLRGLQSLPRAEDRPEKAAALWTLRQAIVTVCVVVALILGGVGIWKWAQFMALQKFRDSMDFTAQTVAKYDETRSKQIDEMTPVQAWAYWELKLKPETQIGVSEFDADVKAAVDRDLRRLRIESWAWWAASAIVLVAALTWAKFAR